MARQDAAALATDIPDLDLEHPWNITPAEAIECARDCEAAGLAVGAWAKSAVAGDLCEMVELPGHPWFFGCQFHPEFTSNPRRGHPLFISFVKAALEHQQNARGDAAHAVAELVASI